MSWVKRSVQNVPLEILYNTTFLNIVGIHNSKVSLRYLLKQRWFISKWLRHICSIHCFSFSGGYLHIFNYTFWCQKHLKCSKIRRTLKVCTFPAGGTYRNLNPCPREPEAPQQWSHILLHPTWLQQRTRPPALIPTGSTYMFIAFSDLPVQLLLQWHNNNNPIHACDPSFCSTFVIVL